MSPLKLEKTRSLIISRTFQFAAFAIDVHLFKKYDQDMLGYGLIRGEICQCRQCRRQCKIFASGVNFSIFTNFLCFFLLKLLKLGEIDGVKFLA